MVMKDTELVKWKPVVGYEDRYEVSSDGQVYSIKSKKMLKPRRHNEGYLKVGLCRNGQMEDFYIHRLMCEAFFGPPSSGRDTVNHLDQRKDHNVLENLEWTSNEKNISYSWNLHYDQRVKTAERVCTSRKPVVAYDKDGNYKGEWPSRTAASNELGIPLTNISKSARSNGRYSTWGLKFYQKTYNTEDKSD